MNSVIYPKSVDPSSVTSHYPSTSRVDSNRNIDLLQGVMEGLPDGIMILSDRKEILYQNNRAAHICRQLGELTACHTPIPQSIWRRCHALIDSRQAMPDQAVIIEDEIKMGEADIRIRVRWLDVERIESSRLLITLEDQVQSAQCRALAEARKYRLTDRETEVWLLKRSGHTYKAIAAKLHIAEDTVKKHIKSIHARREATEWMLE